ncbi:MAG: hypothetical protein LC733_10420 [Actinobacteria bacterium]|nr:hypothetical protein [Actinomycetota bacterium]
MKRTIVLLVPCQSTLHHKLTPPGIAAVGTDRFRLVFEPAIGEHSWRRLQGCLEDMSVDNMLANVVRKRDLAAG